MRITVRVEGDRSFPHRFLDSKTLAADETYHPVEGVAALYRPAMERKAWPPPPEVVEVILEVGKDASIALLARHLLKSAAGKARLWLNGRSVESEEDALAVLQEAQHDAAEELEG